MLSQSYVQSALQLLCVSLWKVVSYRKLSVGCNRLMLTFVFQKSSGHEKESNIEQ